jgi:CRISPR-associated protein (TIGR03984 family)
MTRAIQRGGYTLSVLDQIEPAFADDRHFVWLGTQARQHGLTTLLAHADDGLLWGTLQDGQVKLASQAFPERFPPLRSITLRQVWLFGEKAELFIWRTGGEWRGRVLVDRASNTDWYFDEAQIEVGDHAEEEHGSFTLVAEGQEGLYHAVPIPLAQIPFTPDRRDRHHPLRLIVRHYLDRVEADGTVVIAHSRLVRLAAYPITAPVTQEVTHG